MSEQPHIPITPGLEPTAYPCWAFHPNIGWIRFLSGGNTEGDWHELGWTHYSLSPTKPETPPTLPGGVREAAQAQARELAESLRKYRETMGWSAEGDIAVLLPTLEALHRENAELRASLEQVTEDLYQLVKDESDDPSVGITGWRSMQQSVEHARTILANWSAATRKGGGA